MIREISFVAGVAISAAAMYGCAEPPTKTAAPAATGGSPPYVPPAPRANSIEVPLILTDDGLIYPWIVNNKVTIPFMIDSGASVTMVTPEIAVKLINNGVLSKDNISNSYTMVSANDTKDKAFCWDLRDLEWDFHFEMCSALRQGTNLLGRNWLDTFSSWSIDNKPHVLVLTP